MNDTADRTFAFAAVVQAAQLVDDIAFGRRVDPTHVRPLIRSIFATDPEKFADVYGNLHDLALGVRVARETLGNATTELLSVTRYTLAAIDLAEKLRREDRVVARLGEQLDALGASRDIDPLDPPYQEISAVYQATLSTLQRRIQVRGVPELLAKDATAAQVRTVLLAAVRSAWLWRQLGGRRWHLIFTRSTMRAALSAAEARLMAH